LQKNPANSVLGGLSKRRPKKNLPARKVVNTGSKIDLSVVVPIYNEEDNISDLVERIVEKLKALQRTYEVLLVDDGSTDNSALRVRDQSSLYEQVRGIYLARNYGQSTAMQAGFDEAKGAFICTLDGDLQNDPADIPMMLERLEATGADLISGWRAERQDGAVRKFFSRTANALISRATGVGLHDYGCSLKIYRRRTLERIRLYGELHRFLPALIAEVGGRAIEVKVRHHPRTRGKSKYKLDRTVRVILDLLLISFLRRYMQRPIHLFGSVGLLLGGAGIIILVYLVALKLLLHASIGGRPLLLLGVMSVILGVMMVGQGLIGEVTSRTFFAARGHRQYHLLEEEDVCARSMRAD
jgi:glycosyltransferase involved in cell wall biosynthesis